MITTPALMNQSWQDGMRYTCLWFLLYGFFVLPVLAQVDKGQLAPAVAARDTLAANEIHQYQLPPTLTGLITLQIDHAEGTVYAYLVAADGNRVQPIAIDFTETRLTYVYQLSVATPLLFLIEGSGAYSVLLTQADVLEQVMGDIGLDADIRGRLETRHPQIYTLNRAAIDQQVFVTVELINNRRAIDFQLLDATGAVVLAVAERWTTDTLLRVYALLATDGYRLKLAGLGDYRLRLYAEDRLREIGGEITFDTPVTGTAPEGRSITYQLLATEASVMSVTVTGLTDGIIVRDADNRRLDEQKHFRDGENYTAVFAITDKFPYQIEVFVRGTYMVSLAEGDVSLLPEQVLFANDVFYAKQVAGRTPMYVLEVAQNTEILLTLVLYDGVIYDSVPLLMSADGVVTPVSFLPLSANRLRLSVVPQGEPPYWFIPDITGAHVVSLVTTGVLPEKAIRIRLITDSTNLRSGATLDAPILREGIQGTELLAVARNISGDWLLALTGDGLMVWVFGQLIEPINAANNLTELPLAPRLTPPEPTPTATLTATITSTVTSTPLVMTSAPNTPDTTALPENTPTVTPIPAIMCTISSGGGVNIRLGPGVGYDAAGALTAGQIRGVIGRAEDAAGDIWWQLADATWIRSDLVQEIGDCMLAPRIEIAE